MGVAAGFMGVGVAAGFMGVGGSRAGLFSIVSQCIFPKLLIFRSQFTRVLTLITTHKGADFDHRVQGC